MRCDEVTRELAAPTGKVDALALSRHVATCPDCASWAEASARLDLVWSASRPADPSSGHWEQLWSAVTAEADAEAPAALRLASVAASPARRRWLVPAIAAAFVAQAAAVAALTWMLFRPGHDTPTPSTGFQTVSTHAGAPVGPSQTVEFELEEGQTLFLELDEQGGKVVCRPRFLETADLVAFDGESPDPYALAFQSDLEMLNAMESLE